MRAVCCLAQAGGRTVPALTLASQTGVPLHYLAKVLQQLSSANLIAGRRGLGGGYTLLKPASQITLTDVVRATESVQRIEHCPMGYDGKQGSLCALHRALDGIAALVLNELDHHTIAGILSQPGQDVPLCREPVIQVTATQAQPAM